MLALDPRSASLQATLTRVWSPIGQTPYLGVTPQRDCLHFYGALQVLTGPEVALALPQLEGDPTVHFLEPVAACFPHRPSLLLWDRAPWHQGKARQFVEAHPQFERVYFPPGCPDLNPQEPVWKPTRAGVGHRCDYRHLSDLRRAFQTHRANTLFQFDWIDQYLPAAFYESVFI
jgi:transposase